MKKLFMLSMLLSPSVMAFSGQEVVVDNKGTAGQILISDGVQIDSGHTNGSWVSPNALPSLKGAKGDTGSQGNSGATGSKGDEGIAGKDGQDGKDADNARLDDVEHRMNRTKILAEGVVRVYDAKKFQVNLFANYDFIGRKSHEMGARIEYKLGKSYEERRIDQLERIIHQLIAVAHKPTTTTAVHIDEEGLK